MTAKAVTITAYRLSLSLPGSGAGQGIQRWPGTSEQQLNNSPWPDSYMWWLSDNRREMKNMFDQFEPPGLVLKTLEWWSAIRRSLSLQLLERNY